MNRKALVVSAIGIGAFGLITLGTAGYVMAKGSASAYPEIIQNLAETFKLDPSAVQTVFEQTRDEQRAERLDALVADGTITAGQKIQIIAHQDSMRETMDSLRDKNLSEDEFRAAMKDLRDKTQAWAEENGIPLKVIRQGPKFERFGAGIGARMRAENEIKDQGTGSAETE